MIPLPSFDIPPCILDLPYSLLTNGQHSQLTAQNLPPTLDSLAQLQPFTTTGVRLPDVHKTGLGSSAALITSLVSGLLLHLGVIPSDSFATEGGTESASEGRKLAHNLSQYIHCLAQGKVGSGFDVSAAVFGSQLYTRFDPTVIEPLMKDDTVSRSPSCCWTRQTSEPGSAFQPLTVVYPILSTKECNGMLTIFMTELTTPRGHLSIKQSMELPRRALQAPTPNTADARRRRRGERHALAHR